MSEDFEKSDIVRVDAAIRMLCREDIKSSHLSRAQIAERLSEELGVKVTEAMINVMVADSHANRLPAAWLPAWTKVTGSTRIISYISEQTGLAIATEDDRRFAKLGRAYHARRRADAEITSLERKLEDEKDER